MADGYIEDKMNQHQRGKFKPFRPPKWWVEKQKTLAAAKAKDTDTPPSAPDNPS